MTKKGKTKPKKKTQTKKTQPKKVPVKESNWETFNKYSAALFLIFCAVAGICIGYYTKIFS